MEEFKFIYVFSDEDAEFLKLNGFQLAKPGNTDKAPYIFFNTSDNCLITEFAYTLEYILSNTLTF